MKFLLFILGCFCLLGAAKAQLPLRRVLVNGKPASSTSISQPIQLAAATNDLVLDFEALTTHDSIFYFYRIPSINQAWSQSLYPSAHYQNLSGGQYTFEIYAQSKNHKTPLATLSLEVKEAFWQKWWFWPSIAVYILLVVGIGIYLFFLYDFRQKLKLQSIRNQIASDLHDEVGANLNSIAIFVELLRQKVKDNPALLPILERITSNSEETVTLMRDTVWAINPTNDSTEKLVEKMRFFGIEILSAKNIAFTFDNQLDLKKEYFSMEQRRNLYLVYKEAINNIAKHALATKTTCTLTSKNGSVEIHIIDNGVGFDLSQTFEGNGLKNFKLRSQEELLNVSVRSQKGIGTQVTIQILLG